MKLIKMLRWILTFFLFFLKLPVGFGKSQEKKRTFEDYNSYQNAVLDKITRAQKIAWIATQSITDPEIPVALYFARYRSVKVAVLVEDSQLINEYTQYWVIKTQGFTSSIVDKNFFSKWPTYLVFDQTVVVGSCALDNQAESKCHLLESDSRVHLTQMKKIFGKYLPNVNQAIDPSQGKTRSDYSQDREKSFLHRDGFDPLHNDEINIFAPQNLPVTLPRETEWQKKKNQSHQK